METKSTGTVSVTMRRKTEIKQLVTETTGTDTAERVPTVLKQKNNQAETMEMTTTRTEITGTETTGMETTGTKTMGQKQWGRTQLGRKQRRSKHGDGNNRDRNIGETESGNKCDRNYAATAITLELKLKGLLKQRGIEKIMET